MRINLYIICVIFIYIRYTNTIHLSIYQKLKMCPSCFPTGFTVPIISASQYFSISFVSLSAHKACNTLQLAFEIPKLNVSGGDASRRHIFRGGGTVGVTVRCWHLEGGPTMYQLFHAPPPPPVDHHPANLVMLDLWNEFMPKLILAFLTTIHHYCSTDEMKKMRHTCCFVQISRSQADHHH